MTDVVEEILEPLADQYVTCRRVLQERRGELPVRNVKTNDWLRVLETSEGRLALELANDMGTEQYGYGPTRETFQYDSWTYSKLNEKLGDQPATWTETTTKRGVKHAIEDRPCTVILRSESNLSEEKDDTASVAMADGGQEGSR